MSVYPVIGELCQENANAAAAAGVAAINAGQTSFDFSQLSRIDSSAVVVMIGWQRHAQAQGKSLQFQALPGSLLSLIGLYGLTEQFHLLSPERH